MANLDYLYDLYIASKTLTLLMFAVCSENLVDGLTADNCTALQFNLTANGVCYNGTTPYGIWNETLAKENKIRKILPTEEYLK